MNLPFLFDRLFKQIDFLQSQKTQSQKKLNYVDEEVDRRRRQLAATCQSATAWLQHKTNDLTLQRTNLVEQRFALEYRRNALDLWLGVHGNRLQLQSDLPVLRCTANEVNEKKRDTEIIESKVSYIASEQLRAFAKLPQLESELKELDNAEREQLDKLSSYRQQHDVTYIRRRPSGPRCEIKATIGRLQNYRGRGIS